MCWCCIGIISYLFSVVLIFNFVFFVGFFLIVDLKLFYLCYIFICVIMEEILYILYNMYYIIILLLILILL